MKIGVMGTGRIAEVVVPTLLQMEEIECYAVASRTAEKAELFKNKYGFEKAYGTYEDMLNDPEVELVYIVSPHSHHYEYMMLCLEHGKPVICEKAFTLNAEQAKNIKEYSEEHKVFVTEAIWTRYMPSRKMIKDVIDSGIVGEVRALTANLCYDNEDNPRVVIPELAGGALLDVGVYGLNFTLMSFDAEIDHIESSVKMIDTGVDGLDTITVFFKDGRVANITASIIMRSDRMGILYGTKGYIIVENINNPQSISVYSDTDELLEKINVPEQISGYEYQFSECVKAINEGRTESWSMPLSETVRVMEIMDSIRKPWGLVYPQER